MNKTGATQRSEIDRPGRVAAAIRQHAPDRTLAALLAAGAALAVTALAIRRNARQAERRHPPVGCFINVDGVRVHYAEWGEGTPVVLLHGNGALVEDWAVSGLLGVVAQQYRVLAIDRPGFGYTERPRDRLWTATAQARLIARTIERLRLDRPVVLGHSWGAIAALALGLDHPQATRGLVLLSGYYYPTRRMDVWAFAPPAVPVVGDAMRYTVLPALGRLVAPEVIRRSFAPRPVPARFEERFPLDLALRPWQLRGFAEDSALMIPSVFTMQGRYGTLEPPAMILCGDEDRIVTSSHQSGRLQREIPRGELRILPGLGHMIHYDAHDEIVTAIRRVAEATSTGVRQPTRATADQDAR